MIKLYSSWARTKDARGDRRNPAGVVWQTISLGQKHTLSDTARVQRPTARSLSQQSEQRTIRILRDSEKGARAHALQQTLRAGAMQRIAGQEIISVRSMRR